MLTIANLRDLLQTENKYFSVREDRRVEHRESIQRRCHECQRAHKCDDHVAKLAAKPARSCQTSDRMFLPRHIPDCSTVKTNQD